jgi:hypothetical protein
MALRIDATDTFLFRSLIGFWAVPWQLEQLSVKSPTALPAIALSGNTPAINTNSNKEIKYL